MVRSRRESHHSDGITDPNNLQQISATKSAISKLMHCSKIEEIQGIQRSLSVDLNPYARAMRSTRQQAESVTQEQGGDND